MKHFKQILLAVLVTLTSSVTASAYDFEVDGIFYAFDKEQKYLYVTYETYNKYDKSYYSPYEGIMVIPSEVDYEGKSYPVNFIDSYAFANCKNLETVILPESILGLGLESFTESGIRYITIPAEVSYVSQDAFKSCDKLEEIVIEDGKSTLRIAAFAKCTNVKKVYVGRNLEYNHLPFDGLKNIEEVTIGEFVTEIGDNLFNGCSNLTVLNYNAQTYTKTGWISNIGKDIFKDTALRILNIGENVINFPSFGSSGLGSSFGQEIETINFKSDKLKSFGSGAFKGWTSLKNITIESLSAWCETSFGAAEWNPLLQLHELRVKDEIITDLVVPEDVTAIGNYAFYGATIRTLIVDKGVNSIGSYSFASCTSLTDVTICGQTAISEDAFYKCENLQHVNIWNTLPNYKFLKDIPSTATIYTFPSEVSAIKKVWKGTVVEIGVSIDYVHESWLGETKSHQYLRRIDFEVKKTCPEGFDLQVMNVTIDGRQLKASNDDVYEVEGLTPSTNYDVVVTFSINGINLSIKKTLCTAYLYVDTKYFDSQKGQTSFQFHVGAPSDITLSYTSKGIYFNSQYIEASKIYGTVALNGLVPNKKYTYKGYAVYEGRTIFSGEKTFTTLGLSPEITPNEASPTTFSCQGKKTIIDATLESEWFTFNNTIYPDSTVVLTGLEPNSSHSIIYTVKSKEGSEESTILNFSTTPVEITTLQPKPVSSTCAIVAATTNISEEEMNVGFQWRKYDAPSSLASNEGYAAIYNGTIEGYIKNLHPSSYYNVRAFFKSNTGKYHYGDWITFDPSDFSYFEPTVHTYPVTSISHNSAQVKGYVLAGTDEVTEQGFEYWQQDDQDLTRSASDTQTVTATGQVMFAMIEGLAPSTTYYYRAFVRTANSVTYGEIQSFTTTVDYTAIGKVTAGKTVVGYFNLKGQKTDIPQKGINIVKFSDGTATKIIKK